MKYKEEKWALNIQQTPVCWILSIAFLQNGAGEVQWEVQWEDTHPNLGYSAPRMLSRVQLHGCGSVFPRFCQNMEKEKDTYLNMYTLGIYLNARACVHKYTYNLGMIVEPT